MKLNCVVLSDVLNKVFITTTIETNLLYILNLEFDGFLSFTCYLFLPYFMQGKMSCLMINDIDAGIGRFGEQWLIRNCMNFQELSLIDYLSDIVSFSYKLIRFMNQCYSFDSFSLIVARKLSYSFLFQEILK